MEKVNRFSINRLLMTLFILGIILVSFIHFSGMLVNFNKYNGPKQNDYYKPEINQKNYFIEELENNNIFKPEIGMFLGGSGYDYGVAVQIDEEGNIYVTGNTDSNDFPIKNASNSTFKGHQDIYLAKYDSSGQLVFSTYFGGKYNDVVTGMAFDSMENIYITGSTDSNDFPTKNAYDSTYGGSYDVFVAKFNSNGDLIFSTFIGGNSEDRGTDITVDSKGNSYVTGYTGSDNFPVFNGYNSTYGGNTDSFICKLTPTGQIIFNTYVGGNSGDQANGISLDVNDNIYITGYTDSTDFPFTNYLESTINVFIAFIAKFNTSGELISSWAFGGEKGNYPNDIEVNNVGDVYVTGYTDSNDFPTKNANSSLFSGGVDCFLIKFNSNEQIIFSTYYGGSADDYGLSVYLDKVNNSYITGQTYSYDIPLKGEFDSALNGTTDAFITKYDSSGNLIFSSYVGGKKEDLGNNILVDKGGNIYITGDTQSIDFPKIQVSNESYLNYAYAFVLKITPTKPTSNEASTTENLFQPLLNLESQQVNIILGVIAGISMYILLDSTSKWRIKKKEKNLTHVKKVKANSVNQLSKETFQLLEDILKENEKI